MHHDGFTLAAREGAVDVTVTAGLLALEFTPGAARELARNLDLYAEKAERLTADPDADVGSREGALPDLAVWAASVAPETEHAA